MESIYTSSNLLSYFESHFHNQSLLYSSLSEEDQLMIDFVVTSLKNNIHPKQMLASFAYERLKDLTGINFDKADFTQQQGQNVAVSIIPKETVTAPNSLDDILRDIFKLPKSTENIDTPMTNKSISCSFYSCGNNLSSTYEFANPVDFATCSNSEVSSMYCFTSSHQTRCLKYLKDFSEYAVYELQHEDSNYSYTVNKYRHIYGDTIFEIYDQNSNLLHHLSYTVDSLSTVDSKTLEAEIKSLVTEIHSNIFYNKEFSLINKNETPVVITKKNSYLATLTS